MANYVQPDFRVPFSLATVIPAKYNPLQIGAVPNPVIPQPDFRIPPVTPGVADFPAYKNALQISGKK